MRKDKNYVFLWIDLLIAALLLALDQFTKYLVTLHLKNQPPLVLIDGVLELQYFENTGIAFSLFQNRKSFILITGFLVLAIVLFFLFKQDCSQLLDCHALIVDFGKHLSQLTDCHTTQPFWPAGRSKSYRLG